MPPLSLNNPIFAQMQFDDTTSALICSQSPTNNSDLTQTFSPGCYLWSCQYIIDTNKVTLRGSGSPLCQSNITHGPVQQRYRSVRGEGRLKKQICLLEILRLICMWLSQLPSDWQAIQLSGNEEERKTIIISIISPSPAFLCRSSALLV